MSCHRGKEPTPEPLRPPRKPVSASGPHMSSKTIAELSVPEAPRPWSKGDQVGARCDLSFLSRQPSLRLSPLTSPSASTGCWQQSLGSYSVSLHVQGTASALPSRAGAMPARVLLCWAPRQAAGGRLQPSLVRRRPSPRPGLGCTWSSGHLSTCGWHKLKSCHRGDILLRPANSPSCPSCPSHKSTGGETPPW